VLTVSRTLIAGSCLMVLAAVAACGGGPADRNRAETARVFALPARRHS
jgi:hypothetical protein